MVSIHTPEFDFEKDRDRVKRFVKKFELDHPVYIDNDYGYWERLGANYWPEFYLVDRKGRIRAFISGEMREDSRRAEQVHALIERLLDEPA